MFEDPSIRVLDCAGRALRLDRPRILGIVNVTPDSFSDGGLHASTEAAVAHGLRLLSEGADALDVGGESTRPGAAAVSESEELDRVIPVIERLAKETPLPISIDTSKPGVMRAAVAAGAGLVNDVQAMRQDGGLETVAALGVPAILMHMQGEPRTMQENPQYEDVVAEVHGFLAQRLFACEMAGIPKSRLVIDPGFGFGKSLPHNLRLLRQLGRFLELGCPVLAGVSRKSMLGQLTGRAVEERLAGSLSAALYAVSQGALLLRVHDVAATVDAVKVWCAIEAEPAAPSRKAAPAIRWPDED